MTMTLTGTAPQQLPRYLIEGSRVPDSDKQAFDATKHVNFVPPLKVYTMEELGLEGQGISSNAISEPFSLFTEEAIRQMRGELFSQKVLDKHQYASSFCSNMIRGHCPEYVFLPSILIAISLLTGYQGCTIYLRRLEQPTSPRRYLTDRRH